MRRLVLFVISALLSLGCGNARKLVVTDQNKETVLQKVGESKNISEDDKKLLASYLMRIELTSKGGLFGQALAQQGAAGPPPAYGKSVGEMIEAQRKWQAEQKAQEEKEKRLAAKAKAKADAEVAELKKSLTLVLFDAAPDSGESFMPAEILKIASENTSGRDIRAFEGKLILTDVLGATVCEDPIKDTQLLKAGEKRNLTERIPTMMCAQLRNKKIEDLKSEWRPATILFADGSRLTVSKSTEGE